MCVRVRVCVCVCVCVCVIINLFTTSKRADMVKIVIILF